MLFRDNKEGPPVVRRRVCIMAKKMSFLSCRAVRHVIFSATFAA